MEKMSIGLNLLTFYLFEHAQLSLLRINTQKIKHLSGNNYANKVRYAILTFLFFHDFIVCRFHYSSGAADY